MPFEKTKASQEGAKREEGSGFDADSKAKNQEGSEHTSDNEEDKTESEDDAGDDESEPDDEGEHNDDDEADALRKENKRLHDKLSRRSTSDIESPRGPGLSPAQKDLYTSFQEEVKQDFLAKYPQYRDQPELWKQFVEEFNDRISIVQLAKRKGVTITKGLIAERFNSVHKSIGSNMDVERAREAGKAQAMKNSSRAAIATASSPSGTRSGGKPAPERQRIIPRQSGNINDWFPTKKQ